MADLSNVIASIDLCIPLLEAAIPEIVTPVQNANAINKLAQVADILKGNEFAEIEKNIKTLSTTLKILLSGESPFLSTVVFQGYILEIFELLVNVKEDLEQNVVPTSPIFDIVTKTGEFFLTLAGRMMIRYKVRVEFEQDYEAKNLRAFMILKDLSRNSRFLLVTPDLEAMQNANLDNGIDIEFLSQDSPKEIHEMVSGVLEVKAVQIFAERKNETVFHLDPPHVPGSVDERYQTYVK